MALSKNQNISLENDAETLICELRRSVLKSCGETGRMPAVFRRCDEQMKLEHDATILKAHNAGLFCRAGAAIKYRYAAFSAAVGTLFDPYNLELLFDEGKSLGWGTAIMHFLVRSGFSFLVNGGVSIIITELIEEYYKRYPTIGTNLSQNISNAGIGCIFGALFTVVTQAVLYVYHHLKEKKLEKKLATTNDLKLKSAIQERLRGHHLAKDYILSWRNVIKHVFSLLLGGIAAVSFAGWPILLAAVLVPWVIWAGEKLWDHFNGTQPIGFLSRLSTWLWGDTIVEQQIEAWIYQGDSEKSPDIPKVFMCPITHDMMVHPVINNCGRIYEREALESWLTQNNRDPETNQEVAIDSLRPVPELERYICEYARKNEFVLHKETTETIV
ncbi:unnamed protein product [Rotaria sp. Silwood2]|nr:unnamed protein product [Rotaria sp. Silwood2]CAF4712264.1 unnamed protein product [Rotaria sp. Silwood2]